MSTIYECLRKDKRYIPTKYILLYNAPSEKEAIEYLEQNGGGIYRNILHRFEMEVKSNNKGGEE
jgi:hypothetical protein